VRALEEEKAANLAEIREWGEKHHLSMTDVTSKDQAIAKMEEDIESLEGKVRALEAQKVVDSTLHAQVEAMREGGEEKACRVTELEASLAEMRAQLRSQHMRFEKMKVEWSAANDEVERLACLLEEADGAAMQLEVENSAAKANEARAIEQEQVILSLNVECSDLRMQVMNLTKQLELAVADLETEAKQTERFTTCFLDLSHRLEDQPEGADSLQILNLSSLLGPGRGER